VTGSSRIFYAQIFQLAYWAVNNKKKEKSLVRLDYVMIRFNSFTVVLY
jgi:hypothetical protein